MQESVTATRGLGSPAPTLLHCRQCKSSAAMQQHAVSATVPPAQPSIRLLASLLCPERSCWLPHLQDGSKQLQCL